MSRRDDDWGFFIFLAAIFIIGGLLFPVAAANSAADGRKKTPIWKQVVLAFAGLMVAAATIGGAVYLFTR